MATATLAATRILRRSCFIGITLAGLVVKWLAVCVQYENVRDVALVVRYGATMRAGGDRVTAVICIFLLPVASNLQLQLH